MTALTVKNVPIDQLKGADWNPRHMPDAEMDKLIRSISEFGFIQPVIVNTNTGLVVGGHQRIAAARRLDIDTVPVIEVDLTDSQGKALNLALNKIHGQWEPDKLADLLASLTDEDITLAGFDDRELGSLEDVYFQRRMRSGADPVDPPDEDTETQPGDIWTLGDHILVCGDARLSASYRFGKKATLLLTDPPYGVQYVSPDGRWFAGDDPDGIAHLLATTLAAARPHLTDNAAFYIFTATGPAQLGMLTGLRNTDGYIHRQTLTWVKNQYSLNIGLGAHYAYQHEGILAGITEDEKEDDDEERTRSSREILYGATGPNPHWAAGRGETTALLYDRPHTQPLHPTEKPTELLERLIRNSTRRGDTILDPFAGSGSLLVAAHNRLRKTHLIEVDPRYCDVIVNRYRELTGKRGRKRHDPKLAQVLNDMSPQDPRATQEEE